ncbi:phenol hydroxylase [Pseudomonas stutzeri]|nr:phenol hydroxylase subunit [Stutzerimonas stutzeri]MBK3869740.1 phenol hydroxylase [Stutzerimonas stutzeri]
MSTPEEALEMTPAALDTSKRFVRITGSRGAEFVEFDFAIGEPELFVEMILTYEAFIEFCTANVVQVLPPEPGVLDDGSDAAQWNWRLADATRIRFKH